MQTISKPAERLSRGDTIETEDAFELHYLTVDRVLVHYIIQPDQVRSVPVVTVYGADPDGKCGEYTYGPTDEVEVVA